MNNYTTFVGLDPGITGGIAILSRNNMEVYSIPVQQIIVNKKKKKIYDPEKIVEIFEPHKDDHVVFMQELVSVMPGQGNLSGFNFGRSSGITIGIAAALGFKIDEVRPSMWKKSYPELVTRKIKIFKLKIKKLRAKSKTLKDKALEKANEKEIEKLNRQVKKEAKTAARQLVSKLYPHLKDTLKLTKDDGKAEAVLICLYGKNTLDGRNNELV